MPVRAWVSGVFGLVALAACAGAQKETAVEPTAESVDPDATVEPSSEPKSRAVLPPKVTGGPTHEVPQAATRELTQSDCHVLAQQYGSLTRSDEEAKLSPKLTPIQRNTAVTAIDKAATTLADRWEDGCVRDLVGKSTAEEGLKCSMAAKTVSGFDVCLNGPPAP